MVAPYEVGEPVRSLVRVPTKGRAAKALCWDISRSSSVAAAAAPLQQPLLSPHEVPQDPAGSNSKPRQEQASTPGPPPPASQQLVPRPPPQQQAAATPCESKRPREEEQEGGEGTPQPVLKVARTAGSTEAAPSSSPERQQGLEGEVQWLRQQCQLLRQQNEDLQRRLGLFHGLFRDKQRLTSFVRHLDTLVK